MIQLKTPQGDAFVRPDVVVSILDQKDVGVMTQDGVGEIRSIIVTEQGMQIPTFHAAKEVFLMFFGDEGPAVPSPPSKTN